MADELVFIESPQNMLDWQTKGFLLILQQTLRYGGQ